MHSERAANPVSRLTEPLGGRLIHREATPKDLEEIPELQVLRVPETTLMDCEQFAFGTYSPLTGFMDRDILASVLDSCRLPSGEPWTLPIVLQTLRSEAAGIARGERIALAGETGEPTALIDVTDIYTLDMDNFCQAFFGTTSDAHPGVARVKNAGSTFIGGDITQIGPLRAPRRQDHLTPAQTRHIFTQMGWSRVVAFHGRNPAHRAHETIQLTALERTGADGLYINPVIGPKKAGDFLPDPIMDSYRAVLDAGCYPEGKVVLGSFSTYSRYAGPREAVFTALCRKNMGCSHFIIGRDHTGVGDFYGADANRDLFEEMGDIGIAPVFFEPIGYNPKTGKYDTAANAETQSISGTQARETLKAGKALPEWFMRDIVQKVLLEYIADGRPLFCE